VTFTVLPAFNAGTPLMVIPASVNISGPAGQQSQTVTVQVNSAGPVLFEISNSVPGAEFWPREGPVQTTYTSPTGQFAVPAILPVAAEAMEPGTYYGSLTFQSSNSSVTVPISYTATATPAMPPILSSIVNAASGTAGAIAPGEIITLYGTGIGPSPTSYMLETGGRLATNLSGTSVLINGVPAPLLYASAGQVNAIVPYEVGTSGTATIQVTSNGVTSATWGVPVVSSAPAPFTLTGSGVGGAAVLNQDNSVNGPSNPAGRGTVIQIFATGAGLTSPPSITGSVTQSTPYLPMIPIAVRIGGVAADVQFEGSAPDAVSGLLQVNVAIPQGAPTGPAVAIVFQAGDWQSPAGVTIAVQ
jgi:trimeric autotransporter adhesin